MIANIGPEAVGEQQDIWSILASLRKKGWPHCGVAEPPLLRVIRGCDYACAALARPFASTSPMAAIALARSPGVEWQ